MTEFQWLKDRLISRKDRLFRDGKNMEFNDLYRDECNARAVEVHNIILIIDRMMAQHENKKGEL